jgi:mono/diheme cytochrome c family protein
MPRAWKAPAGAVFLSCAAIVVASQFGCGTSERAEETRASNYDSLKLRAERSSPFDLEIGGDLRGLPGGSVRYLTREDLLALPETSASVSDDANFTKPVRIMGVQLEELVNRLAAPGNTMAVAICSDQYHAAFPQDYLAVHHPILVLTIDGAAPDGWPKDSGGHGLTMGPFLISHAKFAPGFHVLSHADEAQIPWGVVRLEFRNEKSVFGAIAPRGRQENDDVVQSGYRIAQQNCFRCHNMGDEGGQKAGMSWDVLAAWASASPQRFAAYIRRPQSVNPKAEMPAFPNYDDATVAALQKYFATFADRANDDGGRP